MNQIGCDNKREKDGARCQRPFDHNGKCKFPALQPVAQKREALILSCLQCGREIPFQGFRDKGVEPWPQHRCGRFDIAPFDVARPAVPKTAVVFQDP